MADFHKKEMDEQDKDKSKGRKEPEFDDEPKSMAKVIANASKRQEGEKSGKWESLVHTGKEKLRKAKELEEEPFTERSRKEERGGAKRSDNGHKGFVPEKIFRVTAYKAVQEKNSSPPPQKTSESQDKLRNKGDFSSGKSSFSIMQEAQSSHSYKAEEYPEVAEEREESITGFDKSRLGTKDFLGPNGRGSRAWETFQFLARGRGWGRGNYSSNNRNSNNDFQKRNLEEEWDPEYTPKSKKYYLHDDREGEGSDKWMSRGRGRGAFLPLLPSPPWGRGWFMFLKSRTSPKWAHNKFSGEEGEIDDDESGAENREDKDGLQPTAE
ncbi:Thyroid hormone receptor-associated protein 3 [Microtus ochrogaster]|uniref:Thyroid hormone receptor-associated protein 3 n=1 Tax=Microtus ochrogaster TaxID=79684 RepID=A0A8J6FZ44_MICOH|nr:Thyroid hormone receptor-associated protein 3 [Microtus ochrogaster]